MADIPLKSSDIRVYHYDDNNDNNTELKSKYTFQYLVAFSATLLAMSWGTMTGWYSPSFAILLGPNSPITMTSDESSWIVVTGIAGTIIGTVPAVIIMNKWGRKTSLLVGAAPFITGWTLIGFANSVSFLYAGVFCNGLGNGWAVSVSPIYLAEIASDKIRGSLSTLITIMSKFGIVYMFAIGPYVSVSSLAWISMIPPILFLVTFFWLPESPYFLLGKNKTEAATTNLIRLRRHSNVKPEIDRIQNTIEISEKERGTFKELMLKQNRKRYFFCLSLCMTQQLTGFQVVETYAQNIFEKFGSNLTASNASLILAVVQLVSAAISSPIVDMWGRRPLFISSLTGIAICHTIIGLFFFFEKREYDVSQVTWLPVVTMMVFTIFFVFGLATIPYIILGEIFPKNLKGVAAVSLIAIGASTAFIVIKLFQVTTDNLGSEYPFLGFAVACSLFVPAYYWYFPETKGKPLDEIIKLFN